MSVYVFHASFTEGLKVRLLGSPHGQTVGQTFEKVNVTFQTMFLPRVHLHDKPLSLFNGTVWVAEYVRVRPNENGAEHATVHRHDTPYTATCPIRADRRR